MRMTAGFCCNKTHEPVNKKIGGWILRRYYARILEKDG